MVNLELIIQLIQAATVRIQDRFFQVEIVSRQAKRTSMLSERVYAYELYHQMRCVIDLDDSFEELRGLALHGELCKGRSGLIESQESPDMLLHLPAEMGSNVLILEIKKVDGASPNDDIRKIERYVSRFKYMFGASIVFGPSADGTAQVVRARDRLRGINTPGILLFAHCQANAPAVEIGRSNQ